MADLTWRFSSMIFIEIFKLCFAGLVWQKNINIANLVTWDMNFFWLGNKNSQDRELKFRNIFFTFFSSSKRKIILSRKFFRKKNYFFFFFFSFLLWSWVLIVIIWARVKRNKMESFTLKLTFDLIDSVTLQNCLESWKNHHKILSQKITTFVPFPDSQTSYLYYFNFLSYFPFRINVSLNPSIST